MAPAFRILVTTEIMPFLKSALKFRVRMQFLIVEFLALRIFIGASKSA